MCNLFYLCGRSSSHKWHVRIVGKTLKGFVCESIEESTEFQVRNAAVDRSVQTLDIHVQNLMLHDL